MTLLRTIGAALLAALLSGPALAALSERDKADVARVTDYLQDIRSLSARFVQIGPNGELANGTLYLRRPGRLRFEYNPPTPLLVVADGTWLVLHDTELDQVNRWPVYKTPLGVLVTDKIDLEKDVEVVRVARRPGVLSLTIVDRGAPDEGAIELVFSEPALSLRQWHVRDAQGGITNVSLSETKLNVELPPTLFHFDHFRSETDRFRR